MVITRTHWAAGAVLVAALAIAFYAGRGAAPTAKDEPPAPPPLPIPADIAISAEGRKKAEFFARAAMLYVFFHEAGHMVIDELRIPATGPEEDAVDEFAAFVLTDALKAAPEDAKTLYASIVWAGIQLANLWGQETDLNAIPWTAAHSPGQRRHFSMLCIATGADPVRFIPIAVAEGVDQQRLLRCAEDYETKHDAWDRLMAPHAPGFWSKLTGHGQLKLVVGEAKKPEWLAFEKAYTNGDFFQRDVLDPFSATLAFPRDISVAVRGCDVVNAWWLKGPGEPEIVLCHDYYQKVLDMFARDEVRREQAAQKGAAGAGGGAPNPAPGPDAPAPPTPAPPTPAPAPPAPAGGATAETLAGNWICQGQTAAGTAREETTLGRDGSFRTLTVFGNGRNLAIWGRWSVQGSSLRYEVAGSNPPAPIQNPVMVTFQMTGTNTMQAGGLACQKTGGA